MQEIIQAEYKKDEAKQKTCNQLCDFPGFSFRDKRRTAGLPDRVRASARPAPQGNRINQDAGLPDTNRRDPHKQGESPALQSQRRPLRKAAATTQRQSEEATEVLAHLVLSVGPVAATLGTPVVQELVNAFAGENVGEELAKATC